MTLKDMIVEIAPGVKYNTWAFDGHGAPGPVVHVREGQTVEMTLTNGGSIPHSIDFHAARIAPDRRLPRRAAGRVLHLPLHGRRSRRLHVPLRHEAGARAHRQRHVRRDHRPAEGGPAPGRQRVRPGRQRVVHERRRDHGAGVARHGEGTGQDVGLGDVQRLRQPVRHASADRRAGRDDALLGRRRRARRTTSTSTSSARSSTAPGSTPTSTSPPQQGVQTVVVPAGGGAVFDVKIDDEGLYPFVSHAFADVDLGQVGLLKVGNPKGPGRTEHRGSSRGGAGRRGASAPRRVLARRTASPSGRSTCSTTPCCASRSSPSTGSRACSATSAPCPA